MSAIPLLAIDIGNTRTKLGLADLKRLTCSASTAIATATIAHDLLPAIKKLTGPSTRTVITHAALSSVVGKAGTGALRLLEKNGWIVRVINAKSPLPFRIAYRTPESLGADRIANALYCATRYRGRPCIIISAGTALTVDLVADRCFRGGAILPGIRLQLASLHQATDALPALGRAGTLAAPALPGNSTEHCMTGGVLHGCAAAAGGIVRQFRRRVHPQRPLILATGGDWPLLSPLVDFHCSTVPDLTLVGTACLFNC